MNIKRILIRLYYFIFRPTSRPSVMILFYRKLGKYFYNHKLYYLSSICFYKIYKKYHIIISPKAQLGENVSFDHPVGIVIGEGVIIGNNVVIYQNVTLGRKRRDIADYPIVEDNVIIYPNSIIAGKVIVRKNTVIGAGSLLLCDTETDSLYAGIPARRIR